MNEEEVKFLSRQRNLSQLNDDLIKSEVVKLQNESNSVAGKAFCYSHFQYVKHFQKNITFEDAAFYANASYSQLKSSSSLSHFKKPSFKDRISHLIFYFNTNPGIFSQVLYYTLTGVEVLFKKDDYYYFFYHTFPSLYSYFIDIDEANNAIELIKITLRYHFSLNKSSIKNTIQNNQNEFITNLIRGFISGSNPSNFFRYLDIDARLFTIENKRSIYSKINGKLVRADYWKSILKTTILIVEKMIAGINLLPHQICKLFSVLNEVNSDFTDFYIFNIFFHDYIDNKSFCDVIDCSYRQSIYNRTNLYNSMEGIWDTSSLRLKLQQLKNAIITNQNPRKFNFESDLILSTRDINLLLRIASFSIENLNALGFDDLANLCENLNNVFNNVSDKIVISLRKWCFSTKFSYQNEESFPMIYELLEMNPDKEKIKNMFKPFLTFNQILQIDFYNKNAFEEDLKKVNRNIDKSQKMLDKIYECEIFVDELKKTYSYDLFKETSFFLESRIAKCFIKYNYKFILPIFQNTQIKGINEGIGKLYNFLFEWSKLIKLNAKAQKTLNRAVFDQFFDYFVNRVAFRFSFDPEIEKMNRSFELYKGDKQNLPLNIQKACLLYMRISVKQSFKNNLNNIIKATVKLKKDTEREVILAITRSKNKALFWFGELIVRMLTEKTIKDRIFYRYENEAVAIFLNGLIIIEKQ